MLRRKAEAIALLQRLQELSHAAHSRIEAGDGAAAQWSGIGFRAGASRFIAPLAQVAEVLPYPALTRVPGTRSWIKGVSNVRGNLVTIVDLPEFFGGEPVERDLRSRLIVINLPDVYCAVLVNEVLGMRQFDEATDAEFAGNGTYPASGLTPGVANRRFRREGVTWQEYDFRKLVASPGFQDVAA
jgi:twitching motility protein PilI